MSPTDFASQSCQRALLALQMSSPFYKANIMPPPIGGCHGHESGSAAGQNKKNSSSGCNTRPSRQYLDYIAYTTCVIVIFY